VSFWVWVSEWVSECGCKGGRVLHIGHSVCTFALCMLVGVMWEVVDTLSLYTYLWCCHQWRHWSCWTIRPILLANYLGGWVRWVIWRICTFATTQYVQCSVVWLVQLQHLPYELTRLPKLTVLRLDNNPNWTYLPRYWTVKALSLMPNLCCNSYFNQR